MALAIQVDPTPIPLAKYVERVGGTAETWIARHHKGQFPCMKKVGGEWYILPAAVLAWSLNDGNDSEGREIQSDVAEPSNEQEGDIPKPVKSRGRRKAKGGKEEGMQHPLQVWRKTG